MQVCNTGHVSGSLGRDEELRARAAVRERPEQGTHGIGCGEDRTPDKRWLVWQSVEFMTQCGQDNPLYDIRTVSESGVMMKPEGNF